MQIEIHTLEETIVIQDNSLTRIDDIIDTYQLFDSEGWFIVDDNHKTIAYWAGGKS